MRDWRYEASGKGEGKSIRVKNLERLVLMTVHNDPGMTSDAHVR